MKYAADTPIGHDWAGFTDTRRSYGWQPDRLLPGIPAEAVVGVCAPLWTESVTSLAEIEFMLLPRLPAIAELGWSAAWRHDWDDFRARTAAQEPYWRAAGIGYHRCPSVPWAEVSPMIPAPRPPSEPSREGPTS